MQYFYANIIRTYRNILVNKYSKMYTENYAAERHIDTNTYWYTNSVEISVYRRRNLAR